MKRFSPVGISNGAARPADPNHNTFAGYDGYIATTTAKYPDSNASESRSIVFRQKNPGVGTSLVSTRGSGIYSDVAASSSASQRFVAGVNYTVTLVVTRTAASTVKLSFAVTGGELSDYAYTIDPDGANEVASDTVGSMQTLTTRDMELEATEPQVSPGADRGGRFLAPS